MSETVPLTLGKLELHLDRQMLTGPRGNIHLTAQYFALTERLMRRPGVLISHTDLIGLAYPDADREPDNANVRIRQMVSRLRQLVIALGCPGVLIQPEPSVGYRMFQRWK